MTQLLNQCLRCQDEGCLCHSASLCPGLNTDLFIFFPPGSMSQCTGLPMSSYPGFWHFFSIPSILFHGFLLYHEVPHNSCSQAGPFLLGICAQGILLMCSPSSFIVREYRQIRPPVFGGLRWGIKFFPESLVLSVSTYIQNRALADFTGSCWRLSASANQLWAFSGRVHRGEGEKHAQRPCVEVLVYMAVFTAFEQLSGGRNT